MPIPNVTGAAERLTSLTVDQVDAVLHLGNLSRAQRRRLQVKGRYPRSFRAGKVELVLVEHLEQFIADALLREEADARKRSESAGHASRARWSRREDPTGGAAAQIGGAL